MRVVGVLLATLIATSAAANVVPTCRITVRQRRIDRDYLLIPGNEYGLLVVEADGQPGPFVNPSYQPLQPFHLVDIIWIPGGAAAVRTIPRTNLATVVDGNGYVLLVDLSRIDERFDENGPIPDDALFRTAAGVLADNVTTPDPRIVWKSAEPLATGTLAPVIDSDTGMVYLGELLDKTTSVVSAIDPRLKLMSVSDGVELRSIVPASIAPPAGLADPSLAAFRVEVSLPGAIGATLVGGAPTLDVESERIPGVRTEDTPTGWPRANLMGLVLHHVVPDSVPSLRYQRGFNRWVSDPVFAVADPRASKEYAWPNGSDKNAEGCYACERPGEIAADATTQEIFSLGRAFHIRASAAPFASSPYAYVAQSQRLEAVIPTIPADVIHPPPVLTAAQHPPVAEGLLQGTIYLHSGELQTSATDFDFGGRAGWDVTIDRTYRSRTIGLSPLGSGWDASIFKRIRALPNGDAEYRDGTGEVWLFKTLGNGQFTAPTGLFLKLTRSPLGWTLIDQQQRPTTFDTLGRLTSEPDEFFDPTKPDSGNTIHYLYGSDGRLESIVDPVGRRTTLSWNNATGRLEGVTGWRRRTLGYSYDGPRLAGVDLPLVPNTQGGRPHITYGYQDASATFNDSLELATNLTTIKDPKESAAGGAPRVTYEYAPSGADRDRVIGQQWGTGESATVAYNSSASVTVTDVLGQERRYTLTQNDAANLEADRAHVTEVKEPAVPIWSDAGLGQLPDALTPGAPSTTAAERTRTFGFTSGVLQTSKLDGVRETTLGYQPAVAGVGLLVQSTTTSPIVPVGGGGGASSSFIPLTSPITRTFVYQPGSNFLEAMQAGDKRIEQIEPHRNNTSPSTTNSEITSTQTFDEHGLLKASASNGGTDAASAGSKQRIEYFSSADLIHERGLAHIIREGEGADELKTTIQYPTPDTTIETDPRGVVTTTTRDAWDRPIEVRVERPGDPLSTEQAFLYDATGRLERMTERQGDGVVTTSYTYDVMGRRTSTTTDGVATVGSVTTATVYDIANRKITTTLEGGAVTTTELDKLGRVTRTLTETGSSPIEQRFAYDLAGDPVFSTDMQTASANAYDAHGREVAARGPDGALTAREYDEWSRRTSVKVLTSDAAQTVAESSYDYTPAGRLESTTTKVDAGLDRTTAFAWDGGGRTTRTATSGRASISAFDIAGRMRTSAVGAGDLAALTDVFEQSQVTAHSGALPTTTTSTEKGGATYSASMEHNTTGQVVDESVGSLEWKRSYDQLGNLTQATQPARPPARWDVDSRGAVKKETLPDGAQNAFDYDATGAQSAYTDPTSEATSTTRDRIGRPTLRTYADGTTEVIEWDGPRVKSITDRQGRKQSYTYNTKGQLTEIRDGTDALIDLLAYDDAGRLVSWKNADVEVTWEQFDLDGNPKHTTQTRFKDASGFSSSPVILDAITQEHRWNEHDERVKFSMPAAVSPGAGWTRWIGESFDAMGNLSAIERLASENATSGTPLMSASYRAAGRPDARTVFAAGNGTPIVRTYSYDASSSLLSRLDVSVGGLSVAGSQVGYDGLQKSEARLLGISSGQRYARYAYDDRSRLAASVYGTKELAGATTPVPGRAREQLSPADFRQQQERTPQIDPSTTSTLAAKGIDTSAIDPPSASFDEAAAGGHKIAKITKGPLVRPFGYDGAERVDDGRFLYTFDAKGRLVRATEKATVPPIRRATYSYSGTGRLVGRRAEYATVSSPDESDWKVEDRPQILAADGIPADVTFAWDPISDRLLAVYPAGAAGDPIKQIIHGGSAYDDPLETATIDPQTGAVTHYYPVYDEAAAGSLQAVLDDRGQLVARNLTNDPFGADDVALAGPAIDAVKVEAKKSADGEIESVQVTLHATEALAPATLPTAARLAVVDTTGALVRTTTATPTIVAEDPFAIRWTLDPAEWTALTDPTPETIGGTSRTPVALSIAATNTLRASAWGSDVAVMPAPEWITATRSVFTSTELPVEVRESLASLSSYLAGIPASESRTTNLYEIETLPLLGASVADTPIDQILSARMHAHPFFDPLTNLDYVRARWYQPLSGSWMTPDPKGYADSPTLYSYTGGDPVNSRDPLGERIRLRGSLTERNSILRDIRTIVGTDHPDAAARIQITGDELQIVGMTEEQFIAKYDSFAHLLGEMIQSPKMLVIGLVGDAHKGDKITVKRANPIFKNPIWDLGDDEIDQWMGGGVVTRVLRDDKMNVNWFNQGSGLDSGGVGTTYVLYHRDRFPKEIFGVEQTRETVLAHELFGHAYDDLIGWSDDIDYGTLRYSEESSGFSRVNPRNEAIGIWVENQYRKRANLRRRLWYRTNGDYRPPGPVFTPAEGVATPFGRVKKKIR